MLHRRSGERGLRTRLLWLEGVSLVRRLLLVVVRLDLGVGRGLENLGWLLLDGLLGGVESAVGGCAGVGGAWRRTWEVRGLAVVC